MAVGVDKLNS